MAAPDSSASAISAPLSVATAMPPSSATVCASTPALAASAASASNTASPWRAPGGIAACLAIPAGCDGARNATIKSTSAISSGQAGSQAPHKVHESMDAARSPAPAPCCIALARPWGVRRMSCVARHTGQASRHKLQPVQASKPFVRPPLKLVTLVSVVTDSAVIIRKSHCG